MDNEPGRTPGVQPKQAAGAAARPTMKTLADHVGVSRQLVSIVLRDLPGASEETRRKVRAAAEEIGYYPDASARALRGRRSFRLGVLFTMHQPFEVDLVEALFEAAEKRGFSLVLGPLTRGRGQPQVLRELLGQRIEALFVLASEGGTDRTSGLPRNIPIVTVGGPRSAEPHDDLRVDGALGARLVVEHLLGLGHRRIAHVSGGEGPSAAARRAAYEAAMAAAGLAQCIDVLDGDYTEEAGSAAALEILARDSLPTAIMGANDRSAMGILGTLVRHGLRVPEDISVVGFDDATLASLPYIDLTTVGYRPQDLADQAIEAMIRRLDSPSSPWLEHREPPHLVVRSSSGPPRQSAARPPGAHT